MPLGRFGVAATLLGWISRPVGAIWIVLSLAYVIWEFRAQLRAFVWRNKVLSLILCIAVGALIGGGFWTAFFRTSKTPELNEPKYPGKASIYFGDTRKPIGSQIPMQLFEGGDELKAYAGDDRATASIQMRPNGIVSLNVSVKDDNGNSLIEIHDNDFTVSPPNFDRNSNGKIFEVIDADGVVVFQLIRRAPAEIEINGVFKMKVGSYFLAGPKGVLETNTPRYDYAPKHIFKYPSWRYQGEFAD